MKVIIIIVMFTYLFFFSYDEILVVTSLTFDVLILQVLLVRSLNVGIGI